MPIMPIDKDTQAREQAESWLETIKQGMSKLRQAHNADGGPEEKEDNLHGDLLNYALEVSVRTGWYQPGISKPPPPEEFFILLCTGGPAVRIRGRLDETMEPDKAWLEYQHWYTPWQRLYTADSPDMDAVLEFARLFCFQ